ATSEYRAKKLDRLSFTDATDVAQPFELRLEISGAARGTAELADAAVGIPVWWAWRELPDALKPADEDETPPKPDDPTHQPRKADYLLGRPFVYEVRWRIVPAHGFAVRALPSDENRSFGPARLTRHTSAGLGGVVTVVDRFDSGKARLSPAEMKELRVGLGKVAHEGLRLISFAQIGQAPLAAGHVREPLAEFRRLAQLHPKEALHHSQLARALLSGGLGEAARIEARHAVEVEPTSAWAHVTLGWVLQHDAIGRFHRRGWDRAGAIAAYRKAKELDPEDAGVRVDLARVFEHDVDGERYPAG